jgi:asparagine synthase (glutamine-hydrolysing)
MDSSMIVAIMAQDLKADFQTFAIGVSAQDFNELPYARAVADFHHTHHVEACVEADLIAQLPDMIWHLDEPSDPIAACQYHAAALAAQHVKVVLGGDGGDELFAGFDRYLGIGYVDQYARIPSVVRRALIGTLLERLPEGFGYKSLSQKLRWAQQLAALPTVAERYAAATLFFRFNHQEKEALFGTELWREVGSLDSAQIIVEPFNRAPATDVVERMLYADYHTRLPEHSLMLTDRMTMAHGLELRSPFLDHELVSTLASYPRKLKIKGRQLKYILRRLGQDYLPAQILERDKQGFMFPVAYWFRNELYPFLQTYLPESYFVKEGLFRQDVVTHLLEEHRHNHTDHHVRLWMLLNLAVWHDLYIAQQSRETVRANLTRHLEF